MITHEYILASDFFFQGAVLKTGKIIDSHSYDIALMQAAGATLVPMPNPAYEAQAALIRQRQAAGTQTSEVLAFPNETQHPSVVWRGGASPVSGIATTWADVQTFIETTSGAISVFVDVSEGQCIVPADVSFDCGGRVSFIPITFHIQGNGNVFFEDGAELLNVASFRSIRAVGAPTIRPYLRVTLPGQVLNFREGGGITFDVGATQSAIKFDADFCQVALFEGAGLDNGNAPTQPIVELAAGLTFHIFAYVNLIGSGPLPDTLYQGGDPGMTFLVFQDPSNITGFVPQPALLATPTIQKYFYAGQMTAESGATGARPTVAVSTGQMFFDSTLGKPVWWDGAAWVDATGTPA